MSKPILILAGSPRKNGNSAALCREFARGAEESGHQVELVFLRDKKIGLCRACYHCLEHDGVCALQDDMAGLLDRMDAADVVVLASPVYFYSVDSWMKAFIDRIVARWRRIRSKEFYYIMTAAEDSPTVMDCTLECFRGLARCLDGSVERGIIRGKGVHAPGEVRDRPVMREAYEMGRQA